MTSSNSYRFFSGDLTGSDTSDSMFEFDESDVWNVSVSTELRKKVPTSRIWNRSRSSTVKVKETPASLPVSVPDWSKILKQAYTEHRRSESDDDDVEDDEWIPPHEFLARTRMASFSVHEGIGRTLKGRDLSRVRNAIWKKTGFED